MIDGGRWLLDTNVVSELRKMNRADEHVRRWAATERNEDCFLSVVTIAELRFGIESVTEPVRSSQLHRWLASEIRSRYAARILAVDEEVLLTWRRLVTTAQRNGYTYSTPDAIIAATALVHGLTVVTRNTRDFERAGVPLLNPWLAPPKSQPFFFRFGTAIAAAAFPGSSFGAKP